MHKLLRPASRNGVGPLEVFRAIHPADTAEVFQPLGYVSRLPAYAALSQDVAAKTAVALKRASVQNVEKVWTELAYEIVRQKVWPEAPSRLTSLFCAPDPFEALSFVEYVDDAPRMVVRGEVPDGVPWALVDMAGFSTVAPKEHDVDGFTAAWEAAVVAAQGYWAPASTPQDLALPEILVAGPVRRGAQVRLLEEMRSRGLLE